MESVPSKVRGDSPQLLHIKAEPYIKERHMGGVMFWQYASDPKEYLLTAVNEHLYK